MEIGVKVNITDNDFDGKIRQVSELGISSCQIDCWQTELMTKENAERIKRECEEYGVKISTFWCGWSGPAVWNFYDGPLTLGLVPPEYRFKRMEELIHGSSFAKELDVKNIATHVGFLPEVPESSEFRAIVASLKYVVEKFGENGQNFLFETGQETPVTLKRTIECIGTDNVGINLDPANLILYGKANPVDALDIIGSYVKDIHAKDGCYPTDGKNLGVETPLGQGRVNFPALIKKLKEIGYDGPLTIEREIDGDRQLKDIIEGKKYLEELI